MKLHLKTSIIVLAAVLGFTSVATAEEIHIGVAGKDAHTLHSEIVQAAMRVCRDQNLDLFYHTADDQCVASAVEKASLQLQQYQTSRLVADNAATHGGR